MPPLTPADLEKIPIVYLWVDGSDPAYQQRHASTGRVTSRHRDNQDLLYSIRSLETNMPWWKGTLYIVTDNQIPKWLNMSHPRVKLVDHIDIIPIQYMPTSVSNTIEWFLKDIRGIDDYYMALNDDFLFLNPVEPADFLDAEGRLALPFNAAVLENSEQSVAEHVQADRLWNASVHRSMNLLERKLAAAADFKPLAKKYYVQHAPRIFSKAKMKALFELFAPELKLSLRQKCRSDTILDTIYLSVYYMAYKDGLEVKPRGNDFFRSVMDSTHFIELDREIRAAGPEKKFLCLNDTFEEAITSEKLVDLYAGLFPVPSSFEKAGGAAAPAMRIAPTRYTFVSFYSEGAPHDSGAALGPALEPVKKILQGQCDLAFYTPRQLRAAGYEYAVREYADAGCCTGNPKCEKLGFYAWKPAILWLELQKAADGDVIIFHDFNMDKYTVYERNFEHITFYAKKCLQECGFDFFVPREGYTKRNFHHTKSLVIREMGVKGAPDAAAAYWYNFPQVIVNMIFVRKSAASLALVEEWMNACKVERWITGTPNDDPHPGFIWHCPEQGVLTTLLAKWVRERRHGIPLEYPNVVVPQRNLAKLERVRREHCAHLKYLFPAAGDLKAPTPNLDCNRLVTYATDMATPILADLYEATRGRLRRTTYTDAQYPRMTRGLRFKIMRDEFKTMWPGDVLIFVETAEANPLYGENFFQILPTAGDIFGLAGNPTFDIALFRAAGRETTFPEVLFKWAFLRRSPVSEEFLEDCITEAEATGEAEGAVARAVIRRWVAEGRHGIPFDYPNLVYPGGQLKNRRAVDPSYYAYL
jgi:hypothetical protein